jgi:hypothetical protein
MRGQNSPVGVCVKIVLSATFVTYGANILRHPKPSAELLYKLRA